MIQNPVSPELVAELRQLLKPSFDLHRAHLIPALLSAAKEQYPATAEKLVLDWHAQQSEKEAFRMPFDGTGTPASAMTAAPKLPDMLWFGLYRKALTYLAGETAAGKTSLIYNIALSAALNEPLWGVPFRAGRPLRVWYLDPENAEVQGHWKVHKIGLGFPDTLIIDPATHCSLSELAWQQGFRDRIKREKYDLVILDPLVNLFSTEDENDNAEAVRQMAFLKSVALEFDCAILLVHHMGKMEVGAGAYGRGASARLASADVGLTWRSRAPRDEFDDTYVDEAGGVERSDQCRLRIEKNRLGRQGSLYLRMIGQDRFALASHEEWQGAGGKSAGADRKSKLEQAVDAIQELTAQGGWRTRPEIIDALSVQGIGETNTDRAIKQLVRDELLVPDRSERNSKRLASASWAENQPSPKDQPSPVDGPQAS